MAIVRALSGLRVAGILSTSAVLGGCAVAYGLFVTGQQQYLIGWNFRLLSTVSRQFDLTLRAHARALESLAGSTAELGAGGREEAWEGLHQRLYSAADVLPATIPYLPDPIAEYHVKRQSDAGLQLVLRSRTKPATPHVEALLSLDNLLGPILTPKVSSAHRRARSRNRQGGRSVRAGRARRPARGERPGGTVSASGGPEVPPRIL